MIQETITQGWPVKTYRFTGEWDEITTGGRRAAMRNRRTVRCPVYRADDGSAFIDMTQSVAVRPNKVLQPTAELAGSQPIAADPTTARQPAAAGEP